MLVVKIGGGSKINLEGIVADLATIDEPFVIVHGANALRDTLAEKLDTPKQVLTSVSGYSSVFSDDVAIDTILMSYSGLRNKRLVELCQRSGIDAIGLTGIDGKFIQGVRNKGIRVRENGKTLIKRDFSGKPKEVNETLLKLLLDNGYTPVLTIPIIDEQGYAINSENDDIVNVLQASLRANRVLQLIEARGFLDDPEDPTSVVPKLSRDEVSVREQQLKGRIKRKMLALRNLLDGGATEVIIADGRVEHPVQNALAGNGTIIS